MKKLLALVLALVMTLSLCTISNAAFADAKDVNADYEEAVAVLNGMGVFKGYEDGSFKPTGAITRAEVAAIVYRLYTGDVKDKQADLYAGYGKFDDMTAAKWAAGYVGFCANAGFVKGYGNGKFGPSDSVTGYQALAMILRAVGYGKNGEFEGTDWELHVAQIAQQVGALKNVKAVSLKTAATRELVAELLFQVAANVNTVTYTPAFGYVTSDIAKDVKAETLGWKNFKLAKDNDYGDDAWGRPAYVWFSENGKNVAAKDAKYTKKTDDIYATIAEKPVMTFTEATTYCDICEELGESKKAEIESVYTNGDPADKYNGVDELKATATKATVGAQGQLVEVYDMGDDYRFVIIDTYLAKVTKVNAEKLDKNGHVDKDAYVELDLDFTDEDSDSIYYLKGNDYKKGEYLLINVNENDENDVKLVGLGDVELVEVVKTVTPKTMKCEAVSLKADEIKLDGKWEKVAEEIYVDEDVYDEDDLVDVFTKYDIFFDQYGNVIGILECDVEKTTVVIDALYTETVKGKTEIKAELVGTDAKSETFTVKEIKKDDGDVILDKDDIAAISAKSKVNEERYADLFNKLFTYTIDDDKVVTLTAVDPETIEWTDANDEDFKDEDYIASTVVSAKYRWIELGDLEEVEFDADDIRFTDDTIFLIHENDGSYTSVKGDDIGDLKAKGYEIVVDDDGYAEVVYLYGIYRAEDVNLVYVPMQEVKKLTSQKVDGENIPVAKVNVVPANGDDPYIAYVPVSEEFAAYMLGVMNHGDTVQIGGFFVNAVFFKGTTVLDIDVEDDVFYGVDNYMPGFAEINGNTVTVIDAKDLEAEVAVSASKIENIYVIKDGKIKSGSVKDIDDDDVIHVFWAEKNSKFVIESLYVDEDVTDYLEDYEELLTKFVAADKKVKDLEKTIKDYDDAVKDLNDDIDDAETALKDAQDAQDAADAVVANEASSYEKAKTDLVSAKAELEAARSTCPGYHKEDGTNGVGEYSHTDACIQALAKVGNLIYQISVFEAHITDAEEKAEAVAAAEAALTDAEDALAAYVEANEADYNEAVEAKPEAEEELDTAKEELDELGYLIPWHGIH